MSSRAKRNKLMNYYPLPTEFFKKDSTTETDKKLTVNQNSSLKNIKIIRSIYTEELDFYGKVKRLSPSAAILLTRIVIFYLDKSAAKKKFISF